jgi:hypothetical protein
MSFLRSANAFQPISVLSRSPGDSEFAGGNPFTPGGVEAVEDSVDSLTYELPVNIGNMSTIMRVNAGDYLYIDSNPISHGFVVLGWGPALPCGDDALISTENIGDSVVDGNFNPYPESNLPLVPYVADDGVQKNTARPFYCAQFEDSETGQWFNEFTQYRFYRVPTSGTVPCSRMYME